MKIKVFDIRYVLVIILPSWARLDYKTAKGSCLFQFNSSQENGSDYHLKLIALFKIHLKLNKYLYLNRNTWHHSILYWREKIKGWLSQCSCYLFVSSGKVKRGKWGRRPASVLAVSRIGTGFSWPTRLAGTENCRGNQVSSHQLASSMLGATLASEKGRMTEESNTISNSPIHNTRKSHQLDLPLHPTFTYPFPFPFCLTLFLIYTCIYPTIHQLLHFLAPGTHSHELVLNPLQSILDSSPRFGFPLTGNLNWKLPPELLAPATSAFLSPIRRHPALQDLHIPGYKHVYIPRTRL